MLLALLLTVHLAHADTGEPETPVVAAHQLPRGDGLYVRWDPERSYGAGVVVETLAEVAERLAFLMPLADPLMIGDISHRGGGRMFGHTTHHLGLDVDLGLYLHGGRQPRGGFVDVRPDQLDLHATWVLIRTLLNSGRVAFVLLDQDHIDTLRAYLLEELEMPLEVVAPLLPTRDEHVPWSRRGVVRHAPNHRSHLHVRFSPTPDT